MELVQQQSLGKVDSFKIAKSFLIWSFTLTVCLLVVGFPLIVLMMTVGALLSVVLQSVLPVSAVLVVAGGLLGCNVLAIITGAGVLTLKGVHPHEVKWLSWLHESSNSIKTVIYPSCPLTCDISK
ncbi:MAG: hypothetical protein F6K24_27840 [Okeania sp. SIO2D1]|nr:hypothetical protein [Okeania sp. SIO2D1]